MIMRRLRMGEVGILREGGGGREEISTKKKEKKGRRKKRRQTKLTLTKVRKMKKEKEGNDQGRKGKKERKGVQSAAVIHILFQLRKDKIRKRKGKGGERKRTGQVTGPDHGNFIYPTSYRITSSSQYLNLDTMKEGRNIHMKKKKGRRITGSYYKNYNHALLFPY